MYIGLLIVWVVRNGVKKNLRFVAIATNNSRIVVRNVKKTEIKRSVSKGSNPNK